MTARAAATRVVHRARSVAGRVLLARSDNLGDVLLAGPAIRAVATSGAHVTLLVGPRGQAAADLLPGIDRTIECRLPWIDPDEHVVDRLDLERLVAEVMSSQVDLAVILTSHHQSALPLALLLRLAGVTNIAAISPDYPGTLLDVRHQVPDSIHEVERNLSLVGRLGFRLESHDTGALMLHDRVPLGADIGPSRPADYVVVHPGASVAARGITADRGRLLVRALTEAGWPVVVTGGSSEVALSSAVAGDDALDLGGRTTLYELAAVLAGAAAVVCGNSFAAHLSAAVRTPVVSIYAPTVPAARWRPWRIPHVLLGHQSIGCSGCRARSCPVAGQPCVDIDMSTAVLAVSYLVDRFDRLAVRS